MRNYIFSSLERINFKRIEDSLSCSWKKDRNEPSLLFLAVIRISHALDHLFPSSIPWKSAGVISFEDRCHSWGSPSPPSRTIFFRGRSTTSTTKNLSSPWRFSRLCKSRRKRSSSSSFLLIVWPYKEKCGWPAAKWAKRGQGQCSTCRGIDDRQWRKRIRERWLYEEGTGE